MTISVSCPNGHRISAKDKLAGKTVRCPKCKSKIRIPAPQAAVDLELVETLEVIEPSGDADQLQLRPLDAPADTPPPREPPESSEMPTGDDLLELTPPSAPAPGGASQHAAANQYLADAEKSLYRFAIQQPEEILRQAYRITTDQFRLLISIMLVFSVPFALLSWTIGLLPSATLMALLAKTAGLAMANFLVAVVANAALVFAIGRAYLRETTTLAASIQFAVSKLVQILATTLMLVLLPATAIGVVAFLGVFAMVAMGPWGGMALISILAIPISITMVVLSIRLLFTIQVVLLEGEWGLAAMRRSFELTDDKFWELFAMLIVAQISLLVVVGLIGAVPVAIVRSILLIAFQSLFTMFLSALVVVWYFSCRFVKDGFDEKRLAQIMGTN